MMKPTKIPAAILRSSLLLGTNAAVAATATSVTIFGVQLNPPTQTTPPTQLMIITGQGFLVVDKILLGTNNITSLCSLGNASGTLITCTFTPLNPGEYRVVVSKSESASLTDVFDLTAPLAGPTGPAGTTGPAGPAGPAGPLALRDRQVR